MGDSTSLDIVKFLTISPVLPKNDNWKRLQAGSYAGKKSHGIFWGRMRSIRALGDLSAECTSGIFFNGKRWAGGGYGIILIKYHILDIVWARINPQMNFQNE